MTTPETVNIMERLRLNRVYADVGHHKLFDDAADEIERLLAIAFDSETEAQRLRAANARLREATIEECAKVADEHELSHHQNLALLQGTNGFDVACAEACRAVARTIRALDHKLFDDDADVIARLREVTQEADGYLAADDAEERPDPSDIRRKLRSAIKAALARKP